MEVCPSENGLPGVFGQANPASTVAIVLWLAALEFLKERKIDSNNVSGFTMLMLLHRHLGVSLACKRILCGFHQDPIRRFQNSRLPMCVVLRQ